MRLSGSALELREVWQPVATGSYERREYEFELLDRDSRRAFHLHDRDVFARVFDVVVHEHCEQPIGSSSCDHCVGQPVRDALAGVEILIGTWVNPNEPDCGDLTCLDTGRGRHGGPLLGAAHGDGRPGCPERRLPGPQARRPR